MKQNLNTHKLKKNEKVYLIYQELLPHLSNTTPRIDILSMAQKISELPERDRKKEINYITKPLGRQNYYARDVYRMFEYSPWLSLSKEYNTINEFN